MGEWGPKGIMSNEGSVSSLSYTRKGVGHPERLADVELDMLDSSRSSSAKAVIRGIISNSSRSRLSSHASEDSSVSSMSLASYSTMQCCDECVASAGTSWGMWLWHSLKGCKEGSSVAVAVAVDGAPGSHLSDGDNGRVATEMSDVDSGTRVSNSESYHSK